MHDPATDAVDAEIDRLEVGLRQLKIQYDMFFSGALPRQPFELKSELEKIIRRLSASPSRRYHQRFRFTTLVSRYNAMSELWSKNLRSLEEGDRTSPIAGARAAAPRVVTTCRVQDPDREQNSLRLLHRQFLEAHRKATGEEGTVSFPAFVRGIAGQTRRLQERTGCDEIELRIVVSDRKVHLKARPGR